MADIFAITFVIIALVVTVTNKANQQKNSKAAVSSRKSQSAAAATQKKATPQRTVVRVPNAKPVRTVPAVPAAPVAPSFTDVPAVAQPTVAVHHHDDDIFQGSMMAESTEGYDPCHEEQLQPEIPACEAPAPVDPYAQTQTPLFGGQSLMNAIVMNEILTRPEDRANSFGLQREIFMGLFEKKEKEAEAFTLHSKEILNVSGLTFNAAAVLVDNETGVNYLIVTGEHGASVIPRLNPDGTVMVTK